MFGNVWQCLACAMLRGHTCYGHNSSPSSEDRIIREEVVNRDVKRMSLHAQQHHAQWPFKVQESGPNMHIGRLHDYILSQLILSFKSLKIKKKNKQPRSEQYRRLSRFSMRTSKAQIPTPWYRLLGLDLVEVSL